ncbi:hypothetical protein AB833_11800 [Chromatiales bacterium (ex Bugula neritina AB1)]|nr:hypothetical protein AB833_11800 [Chromatiales bacterium (ex Bugula neritina AB1)]
MADQLDLQTAMATPLSGQSFSSNGVTLSESPAIDKIILRADFDEPSIESQLSSVLGQSPALVANTFSNSSGNNTVYWLGPDERLVYLHQQSAAELVDALRAAMPAGKGAVVDVSDYYTVIQLSGENARSVLASGTPFDVHPRVFSAGQCAQTRYGSATVLLSVIDDSPTFDVQVRWSFAQYLWSYMAKVSGYC